MSASRSISYLVDTNIFLLVFARDDEKKYAECIQFLSQIKSGKISAYTTTLNIMEVAWTLESYYRFEKADIVKAVQSILILKYLSVRDNYDLTAALADFSRYPIKLVDCVMSTLTDVKKRNTIVVSYDRDFDTAGVLRMEPKDVLLKS